MKELRNYSYENVHFYNDIIPVSELLKIIFKENQINALADIGCGDGEMLYLLLNKNFINEKNIIYAIDVSEIRIKRIKENFENINACVSDAGNISILPDSCLDLIINSMVIEHIEDVDLR